MHFAETEAYLLVRAQNLFACLRSRQAFPYSSSLHPYSSSLHPYSSSLHPFTIPICIIALIKEGSNLPRAVGLGLGPASRSAPGSRGPTWAEHRVPVAMVFLVSEQAKPGIRLR